MSYKTLDKTFHISREQWEELYNKRYHSDVAIHLDFKIKDSPAFFVEDLEVTNLLAQILRLDKEISLLTHSLPGKALEQYSKKCLIDEIVVTNNIEGVRSTRKDISDALQILEQQNMAMNQFVAELIEKLRRTDIYTLLVKGQGVAQCYVRPLWRACGDVDLLLSAENYEKAKGGLTPLADHVDPENKEKRHLGLSIGDWIVELHGTMHVEMSRRMNKGIDAVQNDCFYGGNVRSWDNNGTTIFLPSPDNDVILVFTHILEHFFIEGVGLKQVCDWCRLLYTYRDSLNYGLLEKRIRKMELVTEWKVFGALAVDELGMPKEAMPMYESRFHQRGQRVLSRIMKSGNMGHNNDLSYRSKYSGLTYKLVALWRRMKDFAGFTKIFPIDAPKFFIHYVFRKI